MQARRKAASKENRQLDTTHHLDQAFHASRWSSGSSRTCEDFLSNLFGALDSNRVRYCVLHSWGELPRNLSSDLDIAVHPEDAEQLASVFLVLRGRGYRLVQVLNYSGGAYYFVFFWFDGSVIRSAALDVIFEHRRGGLVVSSGETLVSGRRKQGMIWIPAPESEFSYLLAKKTWKGRASAQQVLRLKTLVEELGRSRAEDLAGELFLGNLRKRIVGAIVSGQVNGIFTELRRQTWRTSLIRNPFKLLEYLLSDGVRRVRRWFQPTGLFIAILGPDGSGKSSLVQELIQAVGPAFRRRRIFHWRPMLLWRRKTQVDTTQPHSRPPNGGWWSSARLVAHLLDYWLGYCLTMRPLLARSGLVVFDRYFHDMIADPKRYRFGGPPYLVRLVSRFVPKPDLVFILDAPVETIICRKQEVPLEELARQRQVYLQLATSFAHSRVIDSAAPRSRMIEETTEAVGDYLAQRFGRRHAHWLALSASVIRTDA